MTVAGGAFAGPHYLDSAKQQATGRADVFTVGVAQVDDSPAGVFGAYQFERAKGVAAELGPRPQDRDGEGVWFPGLDVVGDGPQCTGFEAVEFVVVGG